MEAKSFLVDQFVKEQLEKWKLRQVKTEPEPEFSYTVVTVSMEPGSGGCHVARKIADRLAFDFFHRDIIAAISESTRMSAWVIDSLEKERLSGVEDFLSSLIKTKYLYPETYLRHLMKVVAAIARHERAVIVGRGANFILPREKRFSVRVVAPLETRVKNVAREHGVSLEEAKKRVLRRESARRAFIRQAFHTDIADPLHYDLILNTETMQLDTAVRSAVAAVLPAGEVH